MSENRLELTNEVLEAYLKEQKDREKRMELDAEAKRISRENEKMAAESLSRKLYRQAELSNGNHSLSNEVKEGRKRLAAKYMDQGITDILEAQRKNKNLLDMAQADIKQFIEDEKNLYIRSTSKNSEFFRSLPDDQKEERAITYLTQILKYGSYGTEQEIAMKQDYEKLIDELARYKKEAMAIQMAKDTFLDENADLIAEARKEKRLRELKQSGLLEELNLVEKQEKSEEDN